MTDAAGNYTGCVGVSCQRLSYDEYGNLANGVSGSGEPFQFTGRRFDLETGLYYYRARYYSPQLGRFLQTDPVGYKDDFNLYTYTGNDPLDKIDPTGTVAAVDDATIFTVAVLAAGSLYVAEKTCTPGSQCERSASAGLDWIGGKIGEVGSKIRGIFSSPDKPATTPADEGKKSPPNPNGSKGSDTPGGNKESRRPDITTTDPDGQPYRENVGRQNQDGTPVSRERKALDDIRNATGQCAFTPYTPCKK